VSNIHTVIEIRNFLFCSGNMITVAEMLGSELCVEC